MPNRLSGKTTHQVITLLMRVGKVMAMLFIIAYPCFAQKTPSTEVSFRNDNDLYLFNKQDQYYTNGLFFHIRKTVDSAALSTKEKNRLWGITIGQKMYNAYTAQIHYVEEVDRPITAYLFLAANVDRYFSDESFLSLAGEMGTIGRWALGRQFQEGIHRVLNLYEIAGWEYQLENAFGLDANAKYSRLLFRNRGQWFDVSAQSAATVGLNHTHASIAPTLRWGKINPMHQSAYWGSRLQSSATTVQREWFVYFEPKLNMIVYDATIQGGLFRQDKGPVTYDPMRWVLSNQFGVMYANNRLTVNLQYIFNTRELPGMFFRHQYGALGVSYRY